MSEYRKSRFGVYPLEYGWAFSVVAPDRQRTTQTGFATEADARKAAKRSARFYDQIERDRVDGIETVRTDRVLEQGVRNCLKCGKPHNRVMTTRRGKKWGSTWATADCETYHSESWEAMARRLLETQAA